MHTAVDRIADHLDRHAPGEVLALYLYGSATAPGGLRPDSDIDLLMVTRRSLTDDERDDLVRLLLQLSGRRATVAPGRPLELTSIVLGDVVPWTYPPVCDFLYGDWLRDELAEGGRAAPHTNPDLAVALTTLLQHGEVVRGPAPEELLDPVPPRDLRRSLHDSLPPLLADLDGDERNVLLTLARMVVTLDTGRIVSKDEAARQVLPTLDDHSRPVLASALDEYLGRSRYPWSEHRAQVQEAATALAARIRAAATG